VTRAREIRFETFRPEHAPAFDALNRAWLVEHELIEEADEPQLTRPMAEIITPGGQIFVALDGAIVVGTCAVIPHAPGGVEIAKLAVAPAAQGLGLGRRLVELCLDFARARGAHRVMLVSNSRLTHAVRLYETMGFEHRPLPEVLPYTTVDVHMELDLG